jgi:multiple sugar transport system substrate-binding protein
MSTGWPRRWRPRLVAAIALVAAGAFLSGPARGAEPARAEPYSREAIARKDYRGVTLEVLTLEKPVLGEPTELHARQFEKLTGAKVNVHFVPFPDLYQELVLGLKKDKYDVVFYGSMWIADAQPFLEPIPREMLESAQYRDVLPHHQNIATWMNVPVQVPIDGDRHYLQYRRDLLEDPGFRAEFRRTARRELEVPRTWKEANEVARFFHGRRLADGSVVSGIAEVAVSDALLGNQFIKRAAPYAKHPDVGGGFYFDLETMEPLINTPGFVRALEDFIASQELYPPGGRNFDFPDVIRSFGKGEAVFSDSWDDPFIQAMERGSRLRNKVGAALSPGSRQVWNRRAGRWDEFPEVNHVPYIVYGWTSAVARASRHKQAAFDFLGFYANPENHASDLLVGRFGMNPFRRSDLDKGFWMRRAGWEEAVAASYVDTLDRMSRSRTRVMDLRIHLGQQYVYALSVGVYRALTGRETPQSALDAVAERWRALTQRVGIEKQRAAYREIVEFEDNLQ